MVFHVHGLILSREKGGSDLRRISHIGLSLSPAKLVVFLVLLTNVASMSRLPDCSLFLPTCLIAASFQEPNPKLPEFHYSSEYSSRSTERVLRYRCYMPQTLFMLGKVAICHNRNGSSQYISNIRDGELALTQRFTDIFS